jgi:hypothetical protein
MAKPTSTKECIILLLSRQWPLSIKQIHSTLAKEYETDITYQAVHKLVQSMAEEKILDTTKGAWKLNPAWLAEQEQFFSHARQQYAGQKNKIQFDPTKKEPQIFEFDSFTDLCVETANLLASRKVNPKPEPFWCVLQYGWWSLKFKFEHLELLYRMIQSCPQSRHIFQKITPFGEWIGTQYRRVGGLGIYGLDLGLPNDLFIQGEYIFEIQTNPEGKKLIEQYWNKWKNVDDVFKEFGLKPEPKIHSTLTITKNPALAQFMKKELEKYFEEKKAVKSNA